MDRESLERQMLFATPEDAGKRLDAWLAQHLEGISRSWLQKLCRDGFVLANGKPAAKNSRLRGGEALEIFFPEPTSLDLLPQPIPLEIIYEDDDLLVVNKPKGMVVHPAPGNYDGTLVNALLYHCADRLSAINGVIRPGIVHRIDKDTSGLLIVAKNDFAHVRLAEQIKAHSFTREYQALVYGGFTQQEGSVDAPIGRNPADRLKMCVTAQNSKEAVTHFQVLSRFDGFTHLLLRLETGRTHQIRVHMAHIGHPVAGDVAYGPRKVITRLHGQCLHAAKIGFIHPRSKEYLEFTAGLPAYFSEFLRSLGHHEGGKD